MSAVGTRFWVVQSPVSSSAGRASCSRRRPEPDPAPPPAGASRGAAQLLVCAEQLVSARARGRGPRSSRAAPGSSAATRSPALAAAGSASFRAAREFSVSVRVGSSSSIERERFWDSLAKAPDVMFRLVIRSASSSSRVPSFWKTTPVESIIRARSPWCSPCRASATIAESRPAGPPYLKASLSDSAAVSPWTIGVLGRGRPRRSARR